MPSVSYSEATTFLNCRRKHFYGYIKNLERVGTSVGLALGKASHSILEAYYREILDAGDVKADQKKALPAAEKAARAEYNKIMESGFEDADNRETLENIIFLWYIPNEPFVKQGWRILAVEKEFRIDVADEEDEEHVTQVPFVVDLIAVDPKGKTALIDHKNVWDFISDNDSALMPQIPLYMGCLRGLGYTIDYGMYNMLRTRKIKGTKVKGVYPGPTLVQMLQTLEVRPTPVRIRRTFMEHLQVAEDIDRVKSMESIELQDISATRVSNKMTCQGCSFKDICVTDLIGGNSKLMEETEYKIRERRTFDASSEVVGEDDE